MECIVMCDGWMSISSCSYSPSTCLRYFIQSMYLIFAFQVLGFRLFHLHIYFFWLLDLRYRRLKYAHLLVRRDRPRSHSREVDTQHILLHPPQFLPILLLHLRHHPCLPTLFQVSLFLHLDHPVVAKD